MHIKLHTVTKEDAQNTYRTVQNAYSQNTYHTMQNAYQTAYRDKEGFTERVCHDAEHTHTHTLTGRRCSALPCTKCIVIYL